MGNVKSQHLRHTDKRASISSDNPAFYHRRWSSSNKQEESRKTILELTDMQSPSMDDSNIINNNRINSNSENTNTGRRMTDADAYHRTLQCRRLKRPKSFPVESSRRMHNAPSRPDHNLIEDDLNRRMQMHHLLKHYFGGKFKAPIQEILLQPSSLLSNDQSKKGIDPVKILDICCGNGEWILEMASEYPNVQCYGVSSSEDYPTMVKPPNTHFFCCDVAHNDTKLEFPDNYFDFVRMEMIYKSYNKSEWKVLVKELSRVLKTGGYFELRDIDPIMKNNGPLGKAFFEQYFDLVKGKFDIDMNWYQHMYNYMENYGGMTDIHFQEVKLPLGWGEDQIPQILLRFIKDALRSHSQDWIELSYELGASESSASMTQILDEAIQNHSYYNFYLCWGRKPYFPQTSMISSPVYQLETVKKESDSEIWALVNGYDE